MAKRQFVLMNAKAAPANLGSIAEFREAIARYNTAPDGGPSKALGMEQLYGPGFILELPAGVSPVTQSIVHVNDEDSAWPVLSRLCKTLGWKLVDMDSGRSFGG
jgi:hypothetical protein